MKKITTLILVICLFLPVAFCHAHGVTRIEKENTEEGIPVIVIAYTISGGLDKSDAISVTLNGHVLSVVFTENLGQVAIDISTAAGPSVDFSSLNTPNGENFYIPNTGSYVVTFTLPNGDVYYGEFEVTD